MANIKTELKRIKTNKKHNLTNNAFKSSLKTAIKKVESLVEEKNVAEANVALSEAFKKLDKALAKGIHHKNYVARQKSRLANLVNSITE